MTEKTTEDIIINVSPHALNRWTSGKLVKEEIIDFITYIINRFNLQERQLGYYRLKHKHNAFVIQKTKKIYTVITMYSDDYISLNKNFDNYTLVYQGTNIKDRGMDYIYPKKGKKEKKKIDPNNTTRRMYQGKLESQQDRQKKQERKKQRVRTGKVKSNKFQRNFQKMVDSQQFKMIKINSDKVNYKYIIQPVNITETSNNCFIYTFNKNKKLIKTYHIKDYMKECDSIALKYS